MIKRISLLLLLLFGFQFLHACTTAVISGRFTKDGRPMLWKHRDTWAINNKIMKFNDGKFTYVGLVNSKDISGKSVWIGMNSEGFAIMNSASYNLNNDTIRQSGLEGRVMKEALQTCKTIDDFESFLAAMEKPSRLEANFGVIDAKGGAAYFELSNFSYEKFDANDPKQAPYGYLIRTNHSITGEMGVGGGYIRFDATEDVFRMATREGRLTPKTIIREASRNTYHALTKVDMFDYEYIPENNVTFISFTDYVPRKGTSSSVVVQGVAEDGDPDQSIMWTVLGWPLASVTIPIWLNTVDLPAIVQYDKNIEDAPLCNLSLQLKQKAFSYQWGYSNKNYIDVNALINKDQSGILQKINAFENSLFNKYEEIFNQTDKEIGEAEINELYRWVDRRIPDFYKSDFGIEAVKIEVD